VQKLDKPVDSSILDISPIAQSDLSKELNTVQNQLKSRHQHNLETANKERNRLKNKLVSVTSENTKFLLELASLKEQEMNINEATRLADKSLLNDDTKDQERFRVLLGQQKDEIEQLRHEIRSLKTKCCVSWFFSVH
jgi:chromosome segregation ATPase